MLASATMEPLKIMISGAPASGKGTQCELIKEKVSLFTLSLACCQFAVHHFMLILLEFHRIEK